MRRIGIKSFLALALGLAAATAVGPLVQQGPAGDHSAGHTGHGMVSAATSVSSIKTGNWSDPTVWSTGAAPASGDVVAIRPGHTVTYNQVSEAVLGDVSVEGTLKFSRTANSRLKTSGNVLVMNGGYLDMGNAAGIMPKTVKGELVFVLTDAQSKAFVGGPAFQAADKGLWVMTGGRWDAHGSPVVRTWSKLSKDGAVGATTVTVENNVSDWPVGGTVVVSSTRDPVDTTSQNELHTIKTVVKQADGKTVITLNAALKYLHAGVAPYRGEVALLTRNVVVRTEITGVAESVYVNDVRTRKFAHTMYMYGAKGDLQYAEFKYMGNYGTLGRYAVHHHMMKESSRGMLVRGISGWYNGFRCVNLHSTQQVLVEDNVCYSSSSTSYFVELDTATGHNLDNVFVHNIGIGMLPKNFADRDNNAVAGESRRLAVDFWPGITNNEAFLGNVSVGDGGPGDWESLGYHFQEIAPAKLGVGGVLPWTMVRNEVHSKTSVGINTWQNPVPSRDVVDTLIWRNHKGGIVWGAYNQRNKYFGAQVLENGGIGLNVTSVDSFLQDSVVAGNGAADNVGIHINGYVVPQMPTTPVWLVRNTFKDLKKAGVSHDHKVCADSSAQLRPIISSGCGPIYMTNLGNTFQNVPRPLDYGWQANANAFVKVFDWTGPSVGSPDFVALRKDQQDPSKRGPISEKLVNSQSFYSPVLDALVTPMTSLPSTISYVDLEPARPGQEPVDFTFTSAQDYPPQVGLQVTRNGTNATLKATPTDDRAVTLVEFFVDWVKVGSRTAAPYEVTVDLANLPADGTSLRDRRYAYLYARAFDGTKQIKGYEQRAYSQVVEVGPESTVGVQPPPPVNSAPTANAGVDHVITLPSGVSLNGTVTDDGLPNGVLTSTWTKVSGPGTVTFANGAAVHTSATFSVAGTYVLRLTASDGSLTASDEVTVTATAGGPPPPPTLRVAITVVGTPQPGQQATFYVRVTDAAGDEVSGASVNVTLDTADTGTLPNFQRTKITGTGGRVAFRFQSDEGDHLPWTITAVVSKDGVQVTKTRVVN